MAANRKKFEESFLDSMESELMLTQSRGSGLNVIEFVEQILDSFDMDLFIQQRVLLKAIYSIEFTPEERALMDKWVRENKCNWKPPEEVLKEINAKRVERGMTEMRDSFVYQDIVFQAGMRCITGDSYLFLPGKGYTKINQLLPTADASDVETPLTTTVQTRHGVRNVVAGLSRTPTATKRVKTRYGYEIEGSLEHPLLVQTSNGLVWKKMSELQSGDYLCIERKPLPTNVYPQNHSFSYGNKTISGPQLAYVLGMLGGDGSCGQKCSVSLTSMDYELEKEFMTLEEFFDKKVAVYNKPGNAAKDLKLFSTTARQWLKNVAGLDYAGSYDKTIPTWIMEGSQEEIKQYLQGLFDTDGYALTNKTTVGISLSSEEMIRQVQILLAGFGLISSRGKRTLPYIRKNGENSTTWRLELSGDDARKFGKLIGFKLTRKQSVVESYGPYNGHGSTVDKIPHLVESLRSAKLLEKASVRGSGRAEKWNKIRRQCGGTTRRIHKDKPVGITYNLLPKVIDYFSDVKGSETLTEELKDLQKQNLFFDEIVAIEDGYDHVYDICVPEVSEYVANGIVSHNSGKSSTVAICVVYEFYKLISADNPQKELGVPSSSSVYITVLASTEEQTKNTIYGYVKSYVLNTTFFKSKINRGEIIVKELEITCPGKNVTIGSGHSRATSVVGRSAVLVCFDELAMFANEEGGSSNAAEVYSRVGRAAATFRDKSKRIAMSSVKNQGDYMQELVEKNWDKQVRGALCFDVSTFDFNPFMTPETAIIAADYDKDIVAAQRDYENIRPGSLYGFLNPVIVEMAAHEVARDQKGNEILIPRDPMANCISRPIEIHRSIDTGETRIMSGLEIGSVKPAPLGQYQSIGHCDPGLDHDSFGFACGHAEYSEKGIITVIDIVLEWIPKNLGKNKTAKIDYINVEEVLLEVAKARQIIRLSFDHWQGESHIQRLYREGIPTTAMHFSGSLQLKIYESLRTRLNQGLVKIPNHPTLIEELKNLELKNGTRVDHPKNKSSDIQGRGFISKDLADCIAVVNWIIASQERSFIRELGQQQGSPNIVSIPSVHAVGNMRAKTNIDWNMGMQ